MTFNLTKGNAAQFIIEFLDTNGVLTIPAGGEIDITYTSGTTTASTAIALTRNGSFFTALWDTSIADYGPGSFKVFAVGSTVVPASTGSLRILDTTA